MNPDSNQYCLYFSRGILGTAYMNGTLIFNANGTNRSKIIRHGMAKVRVKYPDQLIIFDSLELVK